GSTLSSQRFLTVWSRPIRARCCSRVSIRCLEREAGRGTREAKAGKRRLRFPLPASRFPVPSATFRRSADSRRSWDWRWARRSFNDTNGIADCSEDSSRSHEGGREHQMERRAFVKSGALALVTMGLSPTFLRRTAFGMELFNA